VQVLDVDSEKLSVVEQAAAFPSQTAIDRDAERLALLNLDFIGDFV
jgi:hypothetical protein